MINTSIVYVKPTLAPEPLYHEAMERHFVLAKRLLNRTLASRHVPKNIRRPAKDRWS